MLEGEHPAASTVHQMEEIEKMQEEKAKIADELNEKDARL